MEGPTLGEAQADGDGLPLSERGADAVVAEAEAPPGGEALARTLVLAPPLELDAALALGIGVCDMLPLGVVETEPQPLLDVVILGGAPVIEAPAVPLADALAPPTGDTVGAADALPLMDAVIEPVAVGESDARVVKDTNAELLVRGDSESGEPEAVAEEEAVDDGVAFALSVHDTVPEGDADTHALAVAEDVAPAVLEALALALFVAEVAPLDVADAQVLGDAEMDTVEQPLGVALAADELDAEGVAVPDGDPVAEFDADATLPEAVAVPDSLPEPVGLPHAVAAAEAEVETDADGAIEVLPLPLPLPRADTLALPVPLPHLLGDPLVETEGDAVAFATVAV